MSSVEDRIVGMKFDNRQFESAAKTSMSTLDRLKSSLNFSGSNKGLNELQNSANKFSLSGLANGASGIASKFSAASVIAISAIASITSKAVDAGIRIAKAFSLEPLKQGFSEYETNLNAVQTILANTQASGAKLKDVNKVLAELNAYSDKTIYNFGEMAKNIGTFTAAGVDLNTATASIKGIANLAALSGSNSQQASSAMYQLSQAISAGRVSLQDWNSVVNAGMGGTVFQRALAQTAEKMGTLDKGAVKLTGKMKNATINGQSFRESITAKPGEESWLTSDVLTATLKQFTGDMSDAELAAAGFSAEQIKSIQAQAKTAQEAATQVKTFTQLIGTLQESAGSGWANTFQILLGDFDEAKKLWTQVNDVLGGFIGKSAAARNKMLQDWKDLGGRTAALKGVENIFKAIVSVVKPIGEAFREIFPATTGKQLFALTEAFLEFTKTLKIGAGTADKLKRTFAGVFAIFSIGWSVVKAIFNVLGDLFGLVGENSGGFLGITASVGDFLVKLDQAVKKGDLINKFFEGLAKAVQNPIDALRRFGDALDDFFTGLSENPFQDLAKYLGRFRDRLAPLAGVADKVAIAWGGLVKIFKKVLDFLQPAIDAIKGAFSGIGKAIGEAFQAGDFSSVYDALNTGLLAGIVLLIRRFMKDGINIDFGGGFVQGIKDTFGALTNTLTAMQNQIQAKTLLLIAAAVALLTVSIVALSMIDSKSLTKSLTAIAVAFGQLLLAMTILSKISGSAGFVKIPLIAASMVLLATAVLILSAAVTVLSKLSWEELAKGLGGVAALLAMIVLVSAGLGKSSGQMIRAGLAMVPLAVGVKILASAVKDLSGMSWGEMVRGLSALAGSLLVIAGAMTLMPKGMLVQAAGLLILSLALKGIGSALQDMGGMSWEEIAKGMVTLAGSLLILAGGLYLMTATLPGAAALVVAALALAVLTPVLVVFGQMKWESIAKGMVALAGSLLILAGGLYLMTGTIAGAGALVVAAAALAVLAPVLVILGSMSWGMIAKGLVALAGAFAVLGLAGLVLTPLVPSIIALSVAFLMLGASMALIGVGAMAVATAFTIFAAAGAAGITVLLGMIGLIPQFMSKFAEGIIGFATTLASQSDKFTKAFASLIGSLLDAIIILTPKVGQALNVMMVTGLGVLLTNVPKIADVGLRLMLAFLQAIDRNIFRISLIAGNIIIKFLQAMTIKVPQIVKVGTDLIIKLMEAIDKSRARLLTAGAKMIISYVNQLARTIRDNQAAMSRAGRNLASAIISGMTGGLSDLAWRAANAAANMARRAFDAAKRALGINSPSKEFAKLGMGTAEGMALGTDQYSHLAENAAVGMTTSVIDTVKKSIDSMGDMISGDVNFDPVITPVLDLTNISKDASKIGGMLDQKAISADLSYRQALGISNDRKATEETPSVVTNSEPTTILEFNQTNNSPKTLSPTEVYRNTKSQLAMAKEALSRP